MPRRSRRAVLDLLGSGAAAWVAGCGATPPTDTPTERATPGGSTDEPPAGTPSGGSPDTRSETPTQPSEEPACATVPRPPQAWPVPRRSPGRDGYVREPPGFEEAPGVSWEAKPTAPDGSHANPQYGQPVLADGSVYLTNRLERGPQRPTFGHVHERGGGSGDRQWASERLRSPSDPVVWGDLVVVAADDESGNAMLLAFDRSDGTRRWARRFSGRGSGFVTARNYLYLATEDTSGRGTVRALAKDGSTVWGRERTFSDHVAVGPTVGPNAVYVATREGRLYALARTDGTVTWSHRFEHPAARRPYVTDLVATECGVVAVVEGAIRTIDNAGDRGWEIGGEHGPLATDGKHVYATADLGEGVQEARSFSTATGEIRWAVQGPIPSFEPPIVVGEAVLLRTEGAVAALEKVDGTERWRTDETLGNLAVADGALYGTTRDTLVSMR